MFDFYVNKLIPYWLGRSKTGDCRSTWLLRHAVWLSLALLISGEAYAQVGLDVMTGGFSIFTWLAGFGGVGAIGGWSIWRWTHVRRREQAREQLNELALASIDLPVIGIEESGAICFANTAAARLAGCSFVSMLLNRYISDVFPFRNPESSERLLPQHFMDASVVDSAPVAALWRDSNGKENLLSITSQLGLEAQGKDISRIVFLSIRQVDVQRSESTDLFWQANHDPLTGLVNRRGFEHKLAEAVSCLQQTGKRHALLFIDLDRFKLINDGGGHSAGDEFLRQISTVLRRHVRATDVLARLGGDEFAVLLIGCPVEQSLRIANALRLDVANFRFAWRDRTYQVGTSIGLVAVGDPVITPREIVEQADLACYAAKEGGRDQVRVYQPGCERSAVQVHVAESVHEAIEANRFRLFRQRMVSLKGEKPIDHYELLLRMVDRDGRLVPPMVFIPTAERHNMMQAVDRWVIENALPSIRREQKALRGKESIFTINLSGASINDARFAEFVRRQLALHDVIPQTICFEITETLAVASLNQAAELIANLKEIGVRFALDDFGAGMCSFAYLKHLPVDYLKIDGSFVRDMQQDPMSLEIVGSINNIAHSIGLRTIAECVENETTLARLRHLGVDFAQGYVLGRPFYFF